MYKISFYHVKNISVISKSFCECSTCCLSNDKERLIRVLLMILITKSFEYANTLDSIISLSSLNNISDVKKKFKKLINNCNLMY